MIVKEYVKRFEKPGFGIFVNDLDMKGNVNMELAKGNPITATPSHCPKRSDR